MLRIDRFVPTAADAEVGASGTRCTSRFSLAARSRERLRRAVGRVIVDDDDVEWKIGLLRQRASDRIADRPHAIAHRNDDAAFDGKVGVVVNRARGRRRKPGADSLEVGRRDSFHLDLVIAVPRIDVAKMGFAGGYALTAAERRTSARRGARPGRARSRAGGGRTSHRSPRRLRSVSIASAKPLNGGATEQHELAEVEIVADAARLVVDERMQRDRAVGLLVEIVGVQNRGLSVGGHLGEASQAGCRQLNSRRQHPQQVRGVRRLEPTQDFDNGGHGTKFGGTKRMELFRSDFGVQRGRLPQCCRRADSRQAAQERRLLDLRQHWPRRRQPMSCKHSQFAVKNHRSRCLWMPAISYACHSSHRIRRTGRPWSTRSGQMTAYFWGNFWRFHRLRRGDCFGSARPETAWRER